MYGTVAVFRAKPGVEERLRQLMEEFPGDEVPGFIAEYVYRSDADPNTFYIAAIFRDRETYVANAKDPAQHERYLQFRELLVSDPEWHDGEIVFPKGEVK